MTDFPTGNGDPNCPQCKGRGVVPVEFHGFPGGGTQDCSCVFKQDLIANVRRVWKVLLHSESAPSSPLFGKTKQNLWITATDADLRQHLRYVAFRMGTRWDARVVADATLITAWLSTAKNPKDPDVLVERKKGPSDEFLTLVDIAVPFDLLIVRLGVKAAKNREMPGVLAEAIAERMHEDKPTWIVDSPIKPLEAGHVCWDERVEELLSDWDRISLSAPLHGGNDGYGGVAPPPGGGFFPVSMASQRQLEEAAAEAAEADLPASAEDVAEPVGHTKKNPLAGMAMTKEDRVKKQTADKYKKARGRKRESDE